ncbi:hypothetical protein FF011L_29690 [Roseimaritima multifibrata]|uniref:Uncharacterized protein n=1 Tax=Roseimaritima multifibrata TaxID=1930274 RepID=A0A517MH36_9BACT|nr:hypothetical protein [Roseimaritima multifibrata]QDS94191.1 hypothetical protein FF011L_29690 [Roseimaritima multifibrata]
MSNPSGSNPPHNPYTTEHSSAQPYAPNGSPAFVQPSNIVQQVLPFGILLMIHGGIVLMLGFCAAMFPVIALIAQVEPDEEMWMVVGVYGVIASGLFLIGTLQMLAGWKAIQFRNPFWVYTGFGALSLGLFTCYCTPTSLGLLIWGVILMVHNDVKYAFELGKTMNRTEVLAVFDQRQQSFSQPNRGQEVPPQI